MSNFDHFIDDFSHLLIYNSNQEKKMVRVGDYMVTPITFSSIDSASSKEFNSDFIKK